MEDSVKQKKQEKTGGKDREKWKQLKSKRMASKAAESITDWKQLFVMPNSFQLYIKTTTRQLSIAFGLHRNVYTAFTRETVQLLFGCIRDQF